MSRKKSVVIGLCKIGAKDLYLYDQQSHLVHCVAVCLLDFFIHELYQRKGYGKLLFDAVLKVRYITTVTPKNWAEKTKLLPDNFVYLVE